MNGNYIARALCYHGQPLQKIWDDERGVEDLRRLSLTQPNYSVYHERQKYFTFQERAKRLKIHQFLARKACELYDKQLVGNVMEESWQAQMSHCFVPQPPIEFFMNVKDKRKAWAHRMSALKQGDIICASVQKLMSNANRIVVKPLCTAEPLHFYLADIPIKAIISQEHFGPLPLDKQGNPRAFAVNDFIRCEVCGVSADVERLTLGMLGVYNKTPDLKLGLCDLNDFPKYYRQVHNEEHPTLLHYEDMLSAAPEFENPNYDVLFQLNGLQPNESLTLMNYIKVGFPETDYATELRQKQASQWAFRSVADGIEHFKNGQQVEAFQCLNKALNIDPRNVEGLVARGALYANRGSFLKGLKDFEKALLFNKYHVNARKYMGETLVALGRSYEEENRIPDALKAYSDCLNLLPQHEQARISLDALQQQRPSALVGQNLLSTQPNTEMHNLNSNTNTGKVIASSDDSSSSSGSEGNEDSANKSRNRSSYLPVEQDKRAVSDALSVNEFKLDDDKTVNSVRKLLREANKHKKSKKKGKKRKDKDKGRRSSTRNRKKSKSKSSDDSDATTVTDAAMEMLKKIDFAEAFRLMSTCKSDEELRSQIKNYFKQRSESPPPPPLPPPPPVVPTTTRKVSAAPTKYDLMMGPSTSKHAAAAAAIIDEEQPPPAPKFYDHRNQPKHQQHNQQKHQQQQQQKLSFQIKKRPLQMDKFGLLRLATPLSSHSQSRSRSRSRSRSCRRLNSNSNSRSRGRRTPKRRGNSRSRSRTRSRSSRSLSRSRSHSRYSRSRRRRSRTRSSRSRSRSRSYSSRHAGISWQKARGGDGGGSAWYKQRFDNESRDRRSRSSYGRGRRTPSPFVPRRTPSPFVPRRTPSPFVARRTPSPFVARRTPSPFVARRTPSPFVPRRTPSPAARFRRTRSRSISPRRHMAPRYQPRGRGRGHARGRFQHRWNFDNRSNNIRRINPEEVDEEDLRPPGEEEPTIEEVDEMIKAAQKERRQGIIEGDKEILKKKATDTSSDTA